MKKLIIAWMCAVLVIALPTKSFGQSTNTPVVWTPTSPPPEPKCIIIGVLVLAFGIYAAYKIYQWSNRLPLPPPPATPPPPPVVPPPTKTNAPPVKSASVQWPDEPSPPQIHYDMYYIMSLEGQDMWDTNSATLAPVLFTVYIAGETPQMQSTTNMVDWLPDLFEEWDSPNGQIMVHRDAFGYGISTNYNPTVNGAYPEPPFIIRNQGLPFEAHRLAR